MCLRESKPSRREGLAAYLVGIRRRGWTALLSIDLTYVQWGLRVRALCMRHVMIYPLSRSRLTAGIQSSPHDGLASRFKRWLFEPPFSRLTIAARIAAIALALAVPLNLVIAAVIWRLSESASEAQRTSLLYTARSVAAAVDAKLDKYMAFAEALARSPALLEDKLDSFSPGLVENQCRLL
jgi:hypothetical protein